MALTRTAIAILCISSFASAKCFDFKEAPKKINEEVCITGKVVKVSRSPRSGTTFLNFCDDYRDCPFSVVVFPKDMANVGDVEKLEGQTIEIFGLVKDYKGQAEIVLNNSVQLKGESAKIPPAPKKFDAESKGNASAGSATKPTHAKDKKPKKPRDKSDAPGEADTETPPPQ
jgi:DNA/RNA endonuclease YhcR with UshA esterase domain